jgi:hypothetical protein
MSLLTLIPTLPLVTTCSIHEHHLEEKPFILRTCCKKGHFTLSYAFSKSSFRMTPLFFFLCISWIASCKIIIPSKIYLPGKKVVWEGRITLSATNVTILARTLVKILKLKFRRQMGQYCWIFIAYVPFSKRVIVPKLRL